MTPPLSSPLGQKDDRSLPPDAPPAAHSAGQRGPLNTLTADDWRTLEGERALARTMFPAEWAAAEAIADGHKRRSRLKALRGRAVYAQRKSGGVG